jgi:Mce-associated membrane protein
MSPVRKIVPGEAPLLTGQLPESRRRWVLPLVTTAAALLMTGAVTVCTLMLISHESHWRATKDEHAVLIYVRAFMTGFTSLDPFHANDYVQRVLDQATGDFAKQYHAQQNEILLQVARGEPTRGTVLDAGVERWNDDGSASVMVATEVTSKSPDGTSGVVAYRWVVTAKREGDQWKISSLLQVI